MLGDRDHSYHRDDSASIDNHAGTGFADLRQRSSVMTIWYDRSEYPQWVQMYIDYLDVGQMLLITGTLSIIKGENNKVGLQCWVPTVVPIMRLVPENMQWITSPNTITNANLT